MCKVFGKPLKDYWKASGKFLIAILILTVIELLMYEYNLFQGVNFPGIAKLILVFAAAWFAVLHSKFNLKQVAFSGLFWFIAAVWIIVFIFPIKDLPAAAVPASLSLAVFTNFVIYMVIALFSGWLATKIKKKK